MNSAALKHISVQHNVTIRVIDEATHKVVQEHTGHNMATNSMLVGIARHLLGDGILNQGSSLLLNWLPQYMSVGTLGVTDPHEDNDGLIVSIGHTEHVVGDSYSELSAQERTDLEIPSGESGTLDAEQIEALQFIDYLSHCPGYGADGYDEFDNNGSGVLGLGDPVDPFEIDQYDAGSSSVYPTGELYSSRVRRAVITYRDFAPENQSEFPHTIDIVFQSMLSTGMFAEFRGDRDYIFITEAGLWSTPDYKSDGRNGLLAGYRISPVSELYAGMGPGQITDEAIEAYKRNHPEVRPEDVTPARVADYNRELLRSQILRIERNQVVQLIWKIQLGSTSGYGSAPADPVLNLEYVTFSSDSSFSLKTYNTSINWDGTLEYSTDTENWTMWDGTEISSVNNKLYLRGFDNTYITGATDTIAQSNNCRFILTGTAITCTGNIMNLLDCLMVALQYSPRMAKRAFAYLFRGCEALIAAPELPATKITEQCYTYMFYECSSLIEPPALPAITLARNCYTYMFYKCTSLTAAPELPATTLAYNCYSHMFEQCSALTVAPELPATVLAEGCYSTMFYRCTSLIVAPSLPATTLASQCYAMMFQACTSLTTIPELPATTLFEQCYTYMFNGCTKVKLSLSQSSTYTYTYRIPTAGTGTTATDALADMFRNTGGSFTGTPVVNVTYYTNNEPI